MPSSSSSSSAPSSSSTSSSFLSPPHAPPATTTSCLRFGRDIRGKEILEMIAASPLPPEEQDKEASQKKKKKNGGGDPPLSASGPYQGTNRIVMMEWEKAYMEECVAALQIQPRDEVLEVGFGLGYAATAIQECNPRCHVIIECDTAVLSRAQEWKEKHLPHTPPSSTTSSKTSAAVAAAGASTSTSTTETGSRSIEFVRGFWQMELPHLGQFDVVFFDDFPLPFVEEGGGTDEAKEALMPTGGGSRWHHFLDLIVTHHLRPGGRVTGYLSEDLDLGRADCTFTRRPIEVEVDENCTYALAGRQRYYVPLIVSKRKEDDGPLPVGVGHIVTGRARGDAAINSIPSAGDDEEGEKREGEGEGEEGEDGSGGGGRSRSRRKRQKMVALVQQLRSSSTTYEDEY